MIYLIVPIIVVYIQMDLGNASLVSEIMYLLTVLLFVKVSTMWNSWMGIIIYLGEIGTRLDL